MATEERVTYRIVDTDNFDGDYPNERFVAIDIPDERLAKLMAEGVNAKDGEFSSRYYRVVKHIETAYKLQPGFEP